jgi:hypothetical protein
MWFNFDVVSQKQKFVPTIMIAISDGHAQHAWLPAQ